MSEERHRIPFCEHCGNDKPWAHVKWFVDAGDYFCSRYCQENHASFLFRQAMKAQAQKLRKNHAHKA